MSASILPPPPTAQQLTPAWFMSAAGKEYLAAIMAHASAAANLQIVVTKNGVRLPPVAAVTAGKSQVIEITV